MKKLLIFCALVLVVLGLTGCNTYFVQDFIGNPTKHLDNHNKNFIVLVEYKPDYVYNKLKTYFYANQADIYKTYKTQKDAKIYVRNLAKVFKNLNMTTDLYFNISQDEKTNGAVIKIVSLNYELAEYFYDTVKDILMEAERKDKEQEAKRLEELNKEKQAEAATKNIKK